MKPLPSYTPPRVYQPILFAHAILVDKDALQEILYLPDKVTKALGGSLSSSLYNLNDPEQEFSLRHFFVFPDISVRIEGHFRLKIVIGELNPVTYLPKIKQEAFVYTEPFQVYAVSYFQKPTNPSLLSVSFSEQGVKMKLKRQAKPLLIAASDSGSAPETQTPKKKKQRVYPSKYDIPESKRKLISRPHSIGDHSKTLYPYQSDCDSVRLPPIYHFYNQHEGVQNHPCPPKTHSDYSRDDYPRDSGYPTITASQQYPYSEPYHYFYGRQHPRPPYMYAPRQYHPYSLKHQ
ncbi:hypothetical protein HDV01_005712 [Terramyces sp. JEL0728]|nr:hypothetical protein HDV01_005712 [Terramyces sp. JEL0728]